MLCRRRFILQGASLISLSPLAPTIFCRAARAAAAEPDGRVLVVIQLDGGNDGLNTVVPFADDAYAKARPKLRVEVKDIHKLNGQLGLHPRMRAAKELFDDGRLAVVQGVGYPNPDRSHFRSMRIWQTASLKDGEHNGYGWLGRALDRAEPATASGEPVAIYVGDEQTPVSLWARRASAASLSRIEDMTLAAGSDQPPLAETAAEGDDRSDAIRQFVTRQLCSAYAAADQFQRRTEGRGAQSSTKYPDSALSGRLRLIAQLLASGSRARVFYATQGGYDTHAAQQYAHADLLSELSGALKAFVDDLKQMGIADRVVVLTFSEFGRRVAENSSQGTDHGVAAPLFLAGAPVAGGLVGEAPDLTNLDSGDVRSTLDFRRVYATLLDDWLGISSTDVLGEQFERLPLIRPT
jgi:uncharacterized protein (DUF1501 family)